MVCVFRWLTMREDPRTFGLFRVIFGGLLLANVAALWVHADYLYGDAGVMPAADVCGAGVVVLSAMCHLTGTLGAHVVLGAFAASTLAFTLGLHTRITKWTTAGLFLSIVLRNGIALAGEQVFGNFLFALCLSRCDAAYSMDEWRRRRRGVVQVPVVPAWPRHLMILQLCLAYGVAGWAKTGPSWVDGTAFYYVLANDRWFRFEPWWLLSTFGTNLLRAATWGAWWFERLFPLVGLALLLGARFRWLRLVGSRRIWGFLALVFTGMLAILTNIGWFIPATMAATLVLFRGEEVGRVVARLLRRPFTPAARSEPIVPEVTPRTRVLAAFIAWHTTAMVVNAVSLPHLRAPVPEAIRSLTHGWGRMTNTFQFWGMFSPDVPRSRTWLLIDVIDEDGRIEPVFDDRQLLGHRRHPYVLLDRRQKAHTKIKRGAGFRERHARYVCRTWRDVAGRPAAEVILTVRRWPLPSPGFMAAHGPTDPRPAGERYRRDEVLLRHRCNTR
jgi:hypothetical protein